MAYGIEIKSINDPYIELAETAFESIGKAGRVGAFLVDMIPMLKYVPEFVPGAGFKKQARIWRKLQEDFRERPHPASVEAMVLCTFHLSLYTVLSYYSGLRPVSTFIHIHGFTGYRGDSRYQSSTRGNKRCRRDGIRRYTFKLTLTY